MKIIGLPPLVLIRHSAVFLFALSSAQAIAASNQDSKVRSKISRRHQKIHPAKQAVIRPYIKKNGVAVKGHIRSETVVEKEK